MLFLRPHGGFFDLFSFARAFLLYNIGSEQSLHILLSEQQFLAL